MSRRPGYRMNRRPRRDPGEAAFGRVCSAVAGTPEPRDCPRCDGAGEGCGMCGGLGFVPTEEWATLVQLAFMAACGLVPPCEGEGGEAA